MIVPCECGAKLKLDESKIGPMGAKVRCPRWGNVLPVRRPEISPVMPGSPPSAGPTAREAPFATVLLAHDSEVVRNNIASVLLEAGFGVDSAADGHEVLRKASEDKPRAIVLDVGLPGIYGFEVCERLKGSLETNGIKIVLLSLSVYDKRRYKRTPVSLYGADVLQLSNCRSAEVGDASEVLVPRLSTTPSWSLSPSFASTCICTPEVVPALTGMQSVIA